MTPTIHASGAAGPSSTLGQLPSGPTSSRPIRAAARCSTWTHFLASQASVPERAQIAALGEVEIDAPALRSADPTPDALGQLLELYPRPEAVMPSHPTSVVMRRDPNQPRQRPRRWPVVRSEQDRLLDSIELALAEAPPPGDFWDETGGSRQL